MPRLLETASDLHFKTSLKRPPDLSFMMGVFTTVMSHFTPKFLKSEVKSLPVRRSDSGAMGGILGAAVAFSVGIASSGTGDAGSNLTDTLNSRWLADRAL